MDGSLTGAVNQDEVESFFTFSMAAGPAFSLSLSLFGLLEKHSRPTVYHTPILHTVQHYTKNEDGSSLLHLCGYRDV
jgi:hypothetical protein